ncbi:MULTISPECIES: ABC transporter permease [unclassified Streptomyces]|uniref:ABC transporter permease n=1 Tax=unclassified Streptomyces TaxID=2593676 RepID=UPI000DC770FB|nr:MULTISPECIES: ABC transporter permease [unclassified Streptomyces]AWZ04507.1 ABC transporter [Streptomyces sp. ICC4]AWZ15439.1 ABC transporter [Streptomyces sp. ICC1]
MFRTALRNVLAHKARLLMTVLAVVLGVAFVSGTLVFTDTVGKAMSNQSAKSYDGVAVSVTSYGPSRNTEGTQEGEPGISQQTLDKVKALGGVDSASGRVHGFAAVGDQDGKLLGSGWSNSGANFYPLKDGKDPRYTFIQGSGPAGGGQIALDNETAQRGKYQVGDKVRVADNGPAKEYTLAGVFTTEDGAVNAGGSLVLFDTATAQQLYLQPGFYEELSVGAKAGADADRLLAEIKPIVGKDAKAQTGAQLAAEQAKNISNGMKNVNQMLLTFALISLFVGIFLIYNTFTMLVAQRTKELALLRAVGANRGQVKRSVLAEALVVGVISSAMGLIAGIGLAVGMRSTMNAFDVKIPAGPLVVAPGTIAAAIVIGVFVTMLAAWLPARRTAKIAPVAAMGSAHLPATAKSLVLRNSIGGAITLLGLLAVLGGALTGKDGKMIIGAGAFLTMIGIIILLPALSRPVIAAVRPLLEKVFGVAGKLAAQNAVRSPRRTAVTAASLAIGLTLVTALSVLGITMGKAIDRMTTDNLKADYTVSMGDSFGSLDPSVLPALAKAPGVKAVSPQQEGYLQLGDGTQFGSVSGVDPATIGQLLNFDVVSGQISNIAKGEVAVAEKAAKKNGLSVGSTLKVTFEDRKEADLKVGAIYKDMEGMLSSYVVDHGVLGKHLAQGEQPNLPKVLVKMDGGPSDKGEKALVDALGKNPAITFATQQDIRNEMGGMINTALNIMYGLLGMALIISVLGVVNTLAMSVYERTQEIGMLRAIGLDRGKVKNMIRLEAIVISLFGAVIGVALGTFIAWAVGETIKGSIPNYALVIPFDRIAIFMLLAGIVGALAAMWPARSAARLNMLTAIKTE